MAVLVVTVTSVAFDTTDKMVITLDIRAQNAEGFSRAGVDVPIELKNVLLYKTTDELNHDLINAALAHLSLLGFKDTFSTTYLFGGLNLIT